MGGKKHESIGLVQHNQRLIALHSLLHGLREGDGEVLMGLGDGFPKFVATQSVGAKFWIFHMQRQPDKVIKIWMASFFMGCFGKMQDCFQPKIAQETRYR